MLQRRRGGIETGDPRLHYIALRSGPPARPRLHPSDYGAARRAATDPTTSRLSSTASADYRARCVIRDRTALSALRRATTARCRQDIADVFCDQQQRILFPQKLPRFCPLKGTLPCNPLGFSLPGYISCTLLCRGNC